MIRAKNDAAGTWHKLPYLVMKDDILGFINKWPSKWLTPSNADVGTSKAAKGEMGKTTVVIVTKKDKEKEAHKASTKEKAEQQEKA